MLEGNRGERLFTWFFLKNIFHFGGKKGSSSSSSSFYPIKRLKPPFCHRCWVHLTKGSWRKCVHLIKHSYRQKINLQPTAGSSPPVWPFQMIISNYHWVMYLLSYLAYWCRVALWPVNKTRNKSISPLITTQPINYTGAFKIVINLILCVY